MHGVEYIACDAIDVGSLAAVPVDNQVDWVFRFVHLNAPPFDAAHSNLLICQLTAPRAKWLNLVASVVGVVSVDVRSIVVLHIEVDFVADS